MSPVLSTRSSHALLSHLSPDLIPSALQEVVPTGTCVGDHTLIFAPTVGENDSIRTWTTTSIHIVAAKNGEFLVGSRIWEGKPFVVVVGMRVVSRINILAVLEVLTALCNSFIDIRLVVASGPACINALPLEMMISFHPPPTNMVSRSGVDSEQE